MQSHNGTHCTVNFTQVRTHTFIIHAGFKTAQLVERNQKIILTSLQYKQDNKMYLHVHVVFTDKNAYNLCLNDEN